jgi:hypothetical protein
MQKIFGVETDVRKKLYEKLHKKFGLRLPGVLVPSKSSLSGEWKDSISSSYSDVSYSLYYVRKCKVFKLLLRPAHVINFGFGASFDNTCTFFQMIF